MEGSPFENLEHGGIVNQYIGREAFNPTLHSSTDEQVEHEGGNALSLIVFIDNKGRVRVWPVKVLPEAIPGLGDNPLPSGFLDHADYRHA